MTDFRKYDHLERLGHDEVDGILIGRVYVFAKLDGTNASVWRDPDGTIRAGSRNRVLHPESDNHGFCAWVLSDDPKAAALRNFLHDNPDVVVYGEWMVPHTLKTYRPDVWRRFWIFDVHDRTRYLRWDDYGPDLMSIGLDVIEPICVLNNPSLEQAQVQCETNTFLIADGAGLGEGIVLKNYDWKNRQGHQPWAKIVRNAFKEENRRAFGYTEKAGEFQVEVAIVDEFVTPHLVGKTRAKVVSDIANEVGVSLADDPNAQHKVEANYRHRVIPQLLGRVFHDLVTEEIWSMLKKHKNPVVNFKLLQQRVIIRTKELSQDLFS